MIIEELESAVARLPPLELAQFPQWFDQFIAARWARRLESDIAAGRLDAAGQRAAADFEAGRCTLL